MNIAPIVFFDMAAAIVVLAVTLIFVVFYLSRITRILHANFDMKDKSPQGGASSLNDARTKAIKIIDDANSQALDIVSKVTISTDATSEDFKKNLAEASSAQINEFEKVTSDFTKTYLQLLQTLKSKNVEVFQNVSKEIEIAATSEVNNFKESMQKLTTLSQNEVEKKIKLDYETAKKEIESYKQEELEKINSGIYGLLERTSKLVLGKALSLSDHEDLIEKSLEKAKKEGVFK